MKNLSLKINKNYSDDGAFRYSDPESDTSVDYHRVIGRSSHSINSSDPERVIDYENLTPVYVEVYNKGAGSLLLKLGSDSGTTIALHQGGRFIMAGGTLASIAISTDSGSDVEYDIELLCES